MRPAARLGRAVLALALLGVPALAPSGHTATSGSFTKHTYPSVGAPEARDYWQYVPARRKSAPQPLVVFLHGCYQTATQAAAQTRLNELADKRGFVVVYPEQRVSAPSSAPLAEGNGIGCWNWFLPDHQERGRGEPATLAGITQRVVQQLRLDAYRVYVGGASAGGVMAVNLAASYPDVYAAVAVVAGCAYRSCTDVTGALAYAAMGSRARAVPMFVENGTADVPNPYAQARALVSSWLGVADHVDGGLNGSVSRTPYKRENRGLDTPPEPGSGDPCIHNNTWTCPGGVAGFQETYPHTVEWYADAQGCGLLESWTVHGLAHAYPGSTAGEPYSDPLGPDLTPAMYDFFRQHTLRPHCAPLQS